jgi:protein tyrosine/serine phosphatase
VVYIHCNHGQDRTGELAAAYRIRYLNATVEKEMEDNRGMGADVVMNKNAVAMTGAMNGTKADRV